MRVLGLTGGIGMGKSTVAAMLQTCGMPVFDADRAVHALQAPGGAAVPAIAALVPQAVQGGVIDRAVLRQAVIGNAVLMRGLERILHPMVRAARGRFLAAWRRRGVAWVVLDIPLLIEIGADRMCDLVVVVSAPRAVQRQRVARRRGMSAAQADRIIARQMPDGRKRARADVVIHTGASLARTGREVRALVRRMEREFR